MAGCAGTNWRGAFLPIPPPASASKGQKLFVMDDTQARAQVEGWRSERQPLAVVVIPLLFETGAEAEVDATICVACTSATQHRRLLARGWSPQEIEQRLRAQWPTEVKMARADYLVWTEGSLEVHAAQLERILNLVPQ